MKKIVLIVLTILQIISFSCESTEPIKIDEGIKLTTIDAAVVETYLNVNVDTPSVNKELVLERNGNRVISIPASSMTIAVTDTGLTENTVYKYKAKLYEGGKLIGESSEISITTLKPSSHEFVWQTFEVGDITSTLYDVSIIDENNIWAVGEIYLKDSTGQIDPRFYNLAKWDGSTWCFSRVFYYQNGDAYLAHLKSIFAFNKDDVSLGGFMHWNGKNYESIPLNISFPTEVNKIWGTSDSNLYIVGNGGNIAHYNGKSWEKIESGTNVSLTDIHGEEEGGNIFVSGYNDFNPTIMLKYKEGKTEKIIESMDFLTNNPLKISGIIKSVWKKRSCLFISTAYSLYSSAESTKGEGKAIWKGHYLDWGVESIRGNEINDIIGCGVFGKIWHYNGINWRRYDELERQTDGLRRIEIKGNICAAVGYRYINGIERYGLIHIGRRN